MKKNKKNDPDKRAEIDQVKLEIPEDEIWTYQIPGLQAPRIGKTIPNLRVKQIVTVIILVVAISLSIIFSLRALSTTKIKYTKLEDGTYELTKFSNSGKITDLVIDCVDGDETKIISSLREYSFNCENILRSVTIGKSVTDIDSRSFYSCWNLQNIFVDDDNPNYCDIDGVLYDKEMTEVICYPIDHDLYLREQNGYTEELWKDSEGYDDEYVLKTATYRLPETVKKIGQLAFNYSALVTIYLPEGLETIDTMSLFKCERLENIYSYNSDGEYASLPEGLTYIGSDAFGGDQQLTSVYIPDTVTYIGHHAFWSTAYKDGDEIKGLTEVNAALDEESFKNNVETGYEWLPKYDYMLFEKNVDINYSAVR